MPKFLLAIIIVLLFLYGCDSHDKNSATLDAYEEYGQDNVEKLTAFNYFVYNETTGGFSFIRKGKITSDETYADFDLTVFIHSKLEENK